MPCCVCASVGFQEAGLGAELYPASPEELQLLLAFRPADRPCTVHLPREINLLWPEARDRVMEFAVRAAGWVEGMTVHDHVQFGERPDAAIAALREADRRLAEVRNAPWLFVEYAAGLATDGFASLFERASDLERVSACIDVSHVGIQVCRTAYEEGLPRRGRLLAERPPPTCRNAWGASSEPWPRPGPPWSDCAAPSHGWGNRCTFICTTATRFRP